MRTIGEILPDVLDRMEEGPTRWPRVRFGERELIPQLVRLAVYVRDGDTCRICGHCDPSRSTLELDHAVPWSAGGSDEGDNLRVLCGPCNQRRSNFEDGEHRLLPVTWWCQECWHEPAFRPFWRDGTDLNAMPPVEDPTTLAFCAWCHMTAYTDRLATATEETR